jgi:hypothetical protein
MRHVTEPINHSDTCFLAIDFYSSGLTFLMKILQTSTQNHTCEKPHPALASLHKQKTLVHLLESHSHKASPLAIGPQRFFATRGLRRRASGPKHARLPCRIPVFSALPIESWNCDIGGTSVDVFGLHVVCTNAGFCCWARYVAPLASEGIYRDCSLRGVVRG